MRHRNTASCVVWILFLLSYAVLEGSAQAAGCAPGAHCLAADRNGKPNPAGKFTAQCSGTFPDSIDAVPADYTGPRFVMAQSYPTKKPARPKYAWDKIDFRTPEGADKYLMAIRDHIYKGMLPADWAPQKNTQAKWVHVPWMTAGAHPREFVHGLTQERSLSNPELGIRTGVTVKNFAVGFYNQMGAYTLGQVWKDPRKPNATASQFLPGTLVAKILFSAAKPGDFIDPSAYILEGAPEWQANINPGQPNPIGPVRILQMDVAYRDPRAGTTGWVFGTFAYDRNAPGTDGWKRMMPVGLQWGNDPELTPAKFASGDRVKETMISSLASSYAKSHLGFLGRLVGPVDNPKSACMSCHGTSQTPSVAPMTPPASCTDEQKMTWFRNLAGTEPFQRVPQGQCVIAAVTPPPVTLDYSLQVSVGVLAQTSTTPVNVNPCLPTAVHESMASHAPVTAAAPHPAVHQYEVSRDGEEGSPP